MRAFILLLAAFTFSFSYAAEKNVILIVTDDESPTLGCYGDPIARTPSLDALAADGTRFNNAYATTASCAASRSVIMSGLHNHRNGLYGHTHSYHGFSAWRSVASFALPRVMAGAGYRTGLIGKYHVAPEEVYHYETYLETKSLRSTVEMAESCYDFLTSDDTKPFFLYFATTDPHRSPKLDENSKLDLKPNLFGNKPNRGAYPGVKEIFYDPATVPVPSFLTDNPETREELAQYYQAISRIDQGIGRLVSILKETGLYDKTMIVFTADHGMAFPGAKTTVYEAGLRVPFIVRNPYEPNRGIEQDALLSHTDITPSLLDFAGGLDKVKNRPINFVPAQKIWEKTLQAAEAIPNAPQDNFGPAIEKYHGVSWLPILGDPKAEHRNEIHASHTFHEIQMYYPMRVVRDKQYKLIWNIAFGLPYPFASDLWKASSFQSQFQKAPDAPYGKKTVQDYIHRPQFELYRIDEDPDELHNLATDPTKAQILEEYKEKLRAFQEETNDPWGMKWEYE